MTFNLPADDRVAELVARLDEILAALSQASCIDADALAAEQTRILEELRQKGYGR